MEILYALLRLQGVSWDLASHPWDMDGSSQRVAYWSTGGNLLDTLGSSEVQHPSPPPLFFCLFVKSTAVVQGKQKHLSEAKLLRLNLPRILAIILVKSLKPCREDTLKVSCWLGSSRPNMREKNCYYKSFF